MKVTMTKHAMTRLVDSGSVELLKSAGWKESDAKPADQGDLFAQPKEAEEIIVLKPPVKAKSTAKSTLDNAIEQGD